MFFYILMTPVLLASMYMIWSLRQMRKHDQVLYRFCRVRRETMSLIREKNFSLTREDYIALKQVAEMTGDTIHDYNIYKVYIFNFRRFIEAIRRMERMDVTVNVGRTLKGEIKVLRNRYADALMFAFETFTPFLKSERAFRMTQRAVTALATLGISYFKTKARGMAEVSSWLERERHTPTFS